jgi:hypothetical protein
LPVLAYGRQSFDVANDQLSFAFDRAVGFEKAERSIDLRPAGADKKRKLALRDRQRKGDLLRFAGRILLPRRRKEKARQSRLDRMQRDGFELLIRIAQSCR